VGVGVGGGSEWVGGPLGGGGGRLHGEGVDLHFTWLHLMDRTDGDRCVVFAGCDSCTW
jgi:hypothetical protein